jgi:hypothetical protein
MQYSSMQSSSHLATLEHFTTAVRKELGKKENKNTAFFVEQFADRRYLARFKLNFLRSQASTQPVCLQYRLTSQHFLFLLSEYFHTVKP